MLEFESFSEHFGHIAPANVVTGGLTYCRNRRTDHETAFYSTEGDKRILRWAATFLVIAIIAALLGFTGIAGAAADIARFLFFLFIAIFVILLLMGIFAGRKLGP